jgi:hypothetical protein
MLKHQENPYPRDMTDEFIEINKPVDNETLELWDDREWSQGEAPEFSEDLLTRLRNTPKIHHAEILKDLSKPSLRVAGSFLDRLLVPDPSKVVASFLLENSPLFEPLFAQNRTAMTIDLLSRSMIKNRGVNPQGVNATAAAALSKPGKGLWAFRTSSGKQSYITYFQFIPERGKENVTDLKVRVSCSCPSWLWWGGLYNAYKGIVGGEPFLYGPIHFPIPPRPSKKGKGVGGFRTLLLDPVVRDPGHRFVACKHMLACIPWLRSNKLQYPEVEVPPAERVEVDIPKEMEPEELRIPTWVNKRVIENQEPIKGILRKWKTMPLEERDAFIKNLESPSHLIYMGYRFPSEAAYAVLDQLSRRSIIPGLRPRVEKAKRDFLM